MALCPALVFLFRLAGNGTHQSSRIIRVAARRCIPMNDGVAVGIDTPIKSNGPGPATSGKDVLGVACIQSCTVRHDFATAGQPLGNRARVISAGELANYGQLQATGIVALTDAPFYQCYQRYASLLDAAGALKCKS
ncbi:uncharacterized protein B0H18DRAFT_1034997 [Fomitopsis serialis]|uniref:uncharacterized protein n=1 Tax=Fomitopsis serialis TaxID=139415 RepID=UPI00200813FF|nr:uncharacterized protein B0H18DRAFT_1034997 [Neoantrodia serialis]KAH9917336.1 hypothetical protein B0H18DRAFT_1034997 [Neoantrodia serialis]